MQLSLIGGAAPQVRQRAAALLKKFPLAACSAEVQGAAAASEHARGSRRGARGRYGGAGRAPWGHVEYEPAGTPGGRARQRFLPGHDAGAARRACVTQPVTGSEWVPLLRTKPRGRQRPPGVSHGERQCLLTPCVEYFMSIAGRGRRRPDAGQMSLPHPSSTKKKICLEKSSVRALSRGGRGRAPGRAGGQAPGAARGGAGAQRVGRGRALVAGRASGAAIPWPGRAGAAGPGRCRAVAARGAHASQVG